MFNLKSRKAVTLVLFALLLCFMLGVCLTMLLYKLRDKGKNGGDK